MLKKLDMILRKVVFVLVKNMILKKMYLTQLYTKPPSPNRASSSGI